MIDIKRFTGKSVTPKDDALLYDFLINASGIFEGCAINHLGSNQLRVASGRGLIKGREFVVEEEILLATLSDSGTKNGRLLVRVDVSNAETPISLVTQAETILPALVQEDINRDGSIYELLLATYSVDSIQISGLQGAAQTLATFDSRYLSVAQKGAASGLATLDAGKRLPLAQMPFTPVQQGGGANQLSNKVYIGWTGATVDLQIDGSSMGSVMMSGTAKSQLLPIGRGGTGATTAAGALAAIGAAAASHNQPASTITAGTFPGVVTANSNTAYTTRQVRNVVISPNAPGTGYNGDMWARYY